MAECPNCTAPLAGDETFCLQCGTRLIAEPPPRPRWGVPAAIVAAIALIAVAGVVFALEQVESDAEREATKPAAVLERPDPVGGGGERPTEVESWPARTSGYTVALARMPDETTARARATATLGGGIPVGILDASAYPSLASDDWLMYAGRFDTRAEAVEEAARYATAGFPDAEAVLVSPAG